MKKYFYLGLLAFLLFEIANVYFIMPMPGSQGLDLVGFSHFIFTWRWLFRILFLAICLFGFQKLWKANKRILPSILLLLVLSISLFLFYKLSAENMFLKMKTKTYKAAELNTIPLDRQIIGVILNNDAVAYPIQMLGYHHQVEDVVGGEPILVTYCTVCHTGRVFSSLIEGQKNPFRLVGMTHFNAMFEDSSTHSWWQQGTGQCVAGKRKGECLRTIVSQQMSLGEWLKKFPKSRILQEDPLFKKDYAALKEFETGKKSGGLIGTDKGSWNAKSLVFGVEFQSLFKAYDWNTLKQKKYLVDTCQGNRVLLIPSTKTNNCVGYFVGHIPGDVSMSGDTIYGQNHTPYYLSSGIPFAYNTAYLQPVRGSLVFWHSWKSFHPQTLVFKP